METPFQAALLQTLLYSKIQSSLQPGSITEATLDKFVHTIVDSLLEATLLHALITGFYTMLFGQVLVTLIRQRKLAMLGVMTALYLAIVLNLMSVWVILQSKVSVEKATDEFAVVLGWVKHDTIFLGIEVITRSIAMLLADCLLVWRCLILWAKNRWMLVIFLMSILAEVAIIPVYLLLNIKLGPDQVPFVAIVYFSSAAITTSATCLIIYKIFTVSKEISMRSRKGIYQHTIEVLVESGLLYNAVIMVTGSLLVVQGGNTLTSQLRLTKALIIVQTTLTPITGIAPTLITARITSGGGHGNQYDSGSNGQKPLSGMSFKVKIVQSEDTLS